MDTITLADAPKQDVIKKLKTIRSAGQWVEIVGWFQFIAYPIYFALNHPNKAFAIGSIILIYPVSLFLIYNGKYIRYRLGKHTGKYLLLDTIICLVGARGILPLLVAIVCFANYFRYRKLSKHNPQNKSTESLSLHFVTFQKGLLYTLITVSVLEMIWIAR